MLNTKQVQRNHRYKFLITHSELHSDFEIRIKKWFELKKKIEATINILTDSFMNRKNHVEFEFLGFTQALENMHRRITRKEMHFKSRIDEIVNSLPDKVRTALLFNEPNFSEQIKSNRNFFTHYDKKNEKLAASFGELYVLSEKMKIILIASLLKHLDLNPLFIEQTITEKGKFLFNHLIKSEK